MDQVLVECIYCSSEFNPARGKGDHVFPAALGEFEGLRVFRGACPKCNNEIGKSEEELIRCGMEAYLARVSDPPRRRRTTNPKWVGSKTSPPPVMSTKRHGAKLRVRPVSRNPQDIDIPDQIVIEDQDGNHYPILLHAKWTKNSVRAKINALGIVGKFNVHISVSDESRVKLEQVAEVLWPGEELNELPLTEVGNHPVEINHVFQVTDHYFRSIVKMALHYYLCYNKRGKLGNEPEFAAVREFIKNGGEPNQFLISPKESPVKVGTPFGRTPCGGAITPREWCHFFFAEDSAEFIVVCINLFLGPGYVQEPLFVRLGDRLSTETDGGVWAHHLQWTPGATVKGTIKEIAVGYQQNIQILAGPGLSQIDRSSWSGMIF